MLELAVLTLHVDLDRVGHVGDASRLVLKAVQPDPGVLRRLLLVLEFLVIFARLLHVFLECAPQVLELPGELPLHRVLVLHLELLLCLHPRLHGFH